MLTAPLARATAAATVTLALSACGIMPSDDTFTDRSPRSMAKAAFAEMRAATSMRMLGSYEDDDSGYTHVDISLDDTSCTARFRTDAGILQLIKNAEGTWLKADERFWRSQASLPQALAPQQQKLLQSYGRSWIAVQGKKVEFAELCDLDALVKEFKLAKGDTNDTITVGDVVQVGGKDAVPLHGGNAKDRSTVWVAVDGPHHVLKLAPTDDEGMPDEFFFSSFGVRVDAESPPEDEIVTIPGT
jgi:hypothetical protein